MLQTLEEHNAEAEVRSVSKDTRKYIISHLNDLIQVNGNDKSLNYTVKAMQYR